MEHERHKIEYLILLTGLGIFLSLFIIYKDNRFLLKFISGFGSMFYILWGFIHHLLENRLTKLIALEYLLYGCLIFLILMAVLSF